MLALLPLCELVAELIPGLLRRLWLLHPLDLATTPEGVDRGDDFEREDGAGDEAADHRGGDALDGLGAGLRGVNRFTRLGLRGNW